MVLPMACSSFSNAGEGSDTVHAVLNQGTLYLFSARATLLSNLLLLRVFAASSFMDLCLGGFI